VALGIDVPTREEMREIEASNRLFEENGTLYMTATIVTKLDTDLPESTQVTFILTGTHLVTNRYTDPLPFRRFLSYAQTHPAACNSGALLFVGLLEAIINRIADVLERVGADLDATSAEVFAGAHKKRQGQRDFREVLGRIGQSGELVSKARESLVSLGRTLVFVQQTTNSVLTQEVRARLRTLSRDVLAMSDHASFLGDKVMFVLDATLGMVTIDQNNILKIFSVVTVFLLPPSVVGAFYGMNFEFIPLLHETWGQWAALGVMVLSALLPYLIFKKKGWL
jgi:magnesium transporter